MNIGMRHISLSTCGIVPGIRRLAELELQLTLSVPPCAGQRDPIQDHAGQPGL